MMFNHFMSDIGCTLVKLNLEVYEMFNSRKEIDELRLWESVSSLNTLVVEINVTDPQKASFVASTQALLQQVLKVKSLELWLFTTDFVARLKVIEQSIDSLTESIRRYLAIEVPQENSMAELISQLEGIADEARRAGILDFKIRVTNESDKVISGYTAAVISGLEKIKSQEDDFQKSIDSLKTELANLSAEIIKDKTIISEITKVKDDFILELKTENKEFLNSESNRAIELIEQQLLIAKNAVNKIEELEKDSKTLADKVYQKTVSQEYGTYAARQSIIAGIYSFFTICAGIGTAILNWKFAHELTSTSDPLSSIRLVGSISTVAIFAFLAAETSGYRHQARDAKRTQLDLNSVDTAFAKDDTLDGKNLRLEVIKSTFERPRPGLSRWTDNVVVRRARKN